MTGPEVMRAWREALADPSTHPGEWAQYDRSLPDAYPLYVAANGPYAGRWYVRERFPGTRIWRAEEDGSFALLESPPALARREIAGRVFW